MQSPGKLPPAGRLALSQPVLAILLFIAAMQAYCPVLWAADIRALIEPGITAVLTNGRAISVECAAPPGRPVLTLLTRVLRNQRTWESFIRPGNQALPVAFQDLNPKAQRAALLALFPADYVDERGWHHYVVASSGRGQETLFTLAEWLTGNGMNEQKLAAANGLGKESLVRGQKVLAPAVLLREVMKAPTPDRLPPDDETTAPVVPAPPSAPPPTTPPAIVDGDRRPELASMESDGDWTGQADTGGEAHDASGELVYQKDAEGPYALYHLKKGEALYTAVVVRFTDFSVNADILAACAIIQKRSGIPDVTKMEPGQAVKIPLDMLNVQYLPEDAPERKAFEESLTEARRLRGDKAQAANLRGVVVIIDPGHGGNDPGAISVNKKNTLYEDEVAYDIAVRLRSILHASSSAEIHMTLLDRSQGHTASNTVKFTNDTDEELQTTPRYKNDASSKYSANLRWYLANSIYRKARAKGVDARMVIFLSIHCDALFNSDARGAMVYIPGAQYRSGAETPDPQSFYQKFAEAKAHPSSSATLLERRRDEALSRNFAENLLDAMAGNGVKRHSHSDPIRNVIRQSGGKKYVPAVLRNCIVPTKVLVEVANMTNAKDCGNMADPRWRQAVAQSMADAIKAQYTP